MHVEAELDSAFENISNKQKLQSREVKSKTMNSVKEEKDEDEVEEEKGRRQGQGQGQMDTMRWLYLDSESVAILSIDQVKDALQERGLAVDGTDKKLRAALRRAIEEDEDEDEDEEELKPRGSSKVKENEEDDMITVEEIMSLKQSELKEVLKSYGLPSSGIKSVLQVQ